MNYFLTNYKLFVTLLANVQYTLFFLNFNAVKVFKTICNSSFRILKILNLLVLLTYQVTKLLKQISSQETKSSSDSQGISHLSKVPSQQSTNGHWYCKQVLLQNYFKGSDVNMRLVSHGFKVKQRGWKELLKWVTSSRCICSISVCLLIFRLIQHYKLKHIHLIIAFTTTCFGR